jgi:hypothetical protein
MLTAFNASALKAAFCLSFPFERPFSAGSSLACEGLPATKEIVLGRVTLKMGPGGGPSTKPRDPGQPAGQSSLAKSKFLGCPALGKKVLN